MDEQNIESTHLNPGEIALPATMVPPTEAPAKPKPAKRKPEFFAHVSKRLAEEPGTLMVVGLRCSSRNELKKLLADPTIETVDLVVRGYELKTTTQRRVTLS